MRCAPLKATARLIESERAKEGKENLHGAKFHGVSDGDESRAFVNTCLRALNDSGLGDLEEIKLAPIAAKASPRSTVPSATILAEGHCAATEAGALIIRFQRPADLLASAIRPSHRCTSA